MRESRIAFATVVAAAILVALLLAANDRRGVVQTTGAIITRPIARLSPDQRVCQRPLIALDEIAAVRFNPATLGGPTAILVEITDAGGARVLARGRVAEGFDQQAGVVARLDRPVPAGQRIGVCFRNRGPGGLDVYGDDGVTSQCVLAPDSIPCVYRLPHPISSTSSLFIDGRPAPGTVAATFLRAQPETVLAQVSEIFDRASTFRPGFVTPALWWALVVLLLVGGPAAVLWGLGDRNRAAGR